jgi:hypothetical protein
MWLGVLNTAQWGGTWGAPLCTTLRTPCAYIRTRDFLIHSAPDSSLFCDTPPVCVNSANLFPFVFFSFPNDLFSDWFSPFIVHLCSFSKFLSIALVKNFYFRSLIPRHVFYPYASHWLTTPLASHSSTTRAVKRSWSSSHQSFSLRFLHTFVYVHLYVESVWFDCSFCSFPSDSVVLVLPSFLINFAVSENHWKSPFSVRATYISLFSRLILPLPIPSIDCFLLGFCQSNLLAFFFSCCPRYYIVLSLAPIGMLPVRLSSWLACLWGWES